MRIVDSEIWTGERGFLACVELACVELACVELACVELVCVEMIGVGDDSGEPLS